MENCLTCDSTRVVHVCVLSAFSFAALVSVVFRLCSRNIQKTRLELNDYLCIAGLVYTLPFNAGGMLIESLDLYPRLDDFHDAFHRRSDFRARQSQYELGGQGSADWSTGMGYLRNSYSGLSSDTICPNLSDAIFPTNMLSCSRLQSGLFHGRRPSCFLDMSASRIHLGPIRQWFLREPKVSRHVHRIVQPLVGHHGCRTPHASFVGSSNAEEAKASHKRHVLYGSGVSNPQ